MGLINADTFEYEAVTPNNGQGTIIKFEVDEKLYSPGYVVVSAATRSPFAAIHGR